ncbi:hypothetical protein LTR78_001975 [Recurvomyces mirabilis]|uniref:Uncharacterized protein n=1 Tax=Recurvomyces mirabilis TaxID=574656 RepID=A0AAE0WU75_9PEZI|nr:hypothetical protein LTR78_001975 [Recurvomyces mirabilis]KAK5160433.1 hypothetical protein LTS14_001445 [Recurvomyces mirabilis]
MPALPQNYDSFGYAFDMYDHHVMMARVDWIAQNIFYYLDLSKPFPRTGTPTRFIPFEENALIQRRIRRFMSLDMDALHVQHAAEWATLVDEFDSYAQDLGDWYRNDMARRGHKSYVAMHKSKPVIWRKIDYSAGTNLPITPLHHSRSSLVFPNDGYPSPEIAEIEEQGDDKRSTVDEAYCSCHYYWWIQDDTNPASEI